MEGFKNKLVNEGLEVTEADNGITYAILRVLAEENDDFKGDFSSLTKKRKELILNLAEKAEIINRKWEVVTREKTSYDLPSFRETPYEMVKHVMPGEKLTVSEENYSALFWEVTVDTQEGLAEVKKDFIGQPEAPKAPATAEDEATETEVAEVEEEKPFDISEVTLDTIPSWEKLAMAAEYVISQHPAGSMEAFKKDYVQYIDGSPEVIFNAFADTPINGDVALPTLIVTKYLQEIA